MLAADGADGVLGGVPFLPRPVVGTDAVPFAVVVTALVDDTGAVEEIRTVGMPRTVEPAPVVERALVAERTPAVEAGGGGNLGGGPVGRHGGALLSFLRAYRVS